MQDLANLLLRRKKTFHIIAGHLGEGRAAGRAVAVARAAAAAQSFRRTKALRIGPAFAGMGDFQIEEKAFAGLGIRVEQIGLEELAPAAGAIAEGEVAEEMARDRDRFDVQAPAEAHRRSVKLGLGVRAYVERGGYTAWSMNFNAFDQKEGAVDTVPFLEASKLMAEGIGYAGEGDLSPRRWSVVCSARSGTRPLPRSSARTGRAGRSSSRTWAKRTRRWPRAGRSSMRRTIPSARPTTRPRWPSRRGPAGHLGESRAARRRPLPSYLRAGGGAGGYTASRIRPDPAGMDSAAAAGGGVLGDLLPPGRHASQRALMLGDYDEALQAFATFLGFEYVRIA